MVAQRLAGGVQALEGLLRVRVRAQRDRDVLELLQPAPDARRLLGDGSGCGRRRSCRRSGSRAHSSSASRRSSTTLSNTSAHARWGRSLVRAGSSARTSTRSSSRGESGVVGPHRVVQRGDEQHERRDALLTVDEHELGRIVRRALRGEDRADEVRFGVAGPRRRRGCRRAAARIRRCPSGTGAGRPARRCSSRSADSQAMVLTAFASTFVAVPMVSVRPPQRRRRRRMRRSHSRRRTRPKGV